MIVSVLCGACQAAATNDVNTVGEILSALTLACPKCGNTAGNGYGQDTLTLGIMAKPTLRRWHK